MGGRFRLATRATTRRTNRAAASPDGQEVEAVRAWEDGQKISADFIERFGRGQTARYPEIVAAGEKMSRHPRMRYFWGGQSLL